MPFLISFSLLMLSFGGLYYNGRSLDLNCKTVNSETICDYKIKILEFTLESGQKERLLRWSEGKYSLHLYFENQQISTGFIGHLPNFNEHFQYRPFSIWLLWLFCFLPCVGIFLFVIFFLREWFKKT